jgi:hypothetical protein
MNHGRRSICEPSVEADFLGWASTFGSVGLF